MTARPKHIIYPLHYFDFSWNRSEKTIEEFEAKLAEHLGDGVYVKLIGRARAGLFLLAKLAIGGVRKKVILSPFTIPDVVNMVKFAGAQPVFVDVVRDSTNIDLDHLCDLIDESTCCVIVTHYHFNHAQMDEIRKVCAEKNIMLVDDCALAFGASESNGRMIGTTTDARVFSFSGFKTLNFFWGGAITTRSPELAKRISHEIRDWRPLRRSQYLEQLLKILKYDLMTRKGAFSAITFPLLRRKVLRENNQEILPMVRVESKEVNQTILSRPSPWAIQEWNRKLETVGAFAQHRRAIAAVYDKTLQAHLVSKETPIAARTNSCLVNYPIIVGARSRTEIFKRIMSEGFDAGLSLYPNVHEMQGFERIPGESSNVSRLIRTVISLPTHPRISKEYASDLSQVVSSAIYATA